jgi:hypothetical protein
VWLEYLVLYCGIPKCKYGVGAELSGYSDMLILTTERERERDIWFV